MPPEHYLLHRIAAKHCAAASGIQSPTRHFLIGVRPQQIAHPAFVRQLALPIDQTDLVQRGDRRGEAAVHAEEAAVD